MDPKVPTAKARIEIGVITMRRVGGPSRGRIVVVLINMGINKNPRTPIGIVYIYCFGRSAYLALIESIAPINS